MEVPPSRCIRRSVKIRTELTPDPSPASGHQGDMCTNIREILLQICSKDAPNITKPQIATLLNVVAKQIEGKDCHLSGIGLMDLFTCLKIPLLNDSKVVRTAGLRVIRLSLHNDESVKTLIKTNLHHFIAKCLDVTLDNMAERAQALRLCRKMLLVDPLSFPAALGRCVVALAIDGSKEKDRLVRASFALLAELCVLNPSSFISSGGIRCFAASVLDCPSSRMQEAMIAALLYLLNTESRRRISGLNLRFLIAPYSDFHYKHNIDVDANNANNANLSNDDRELRLTCAKQALLSVLRSWPGLLHVISCNIFDNMVQVLLPCHLETRKAMLEFFYTLLRLPLPEWTDEFTVALLATDPSRVQDAWKLQEGHIALEGKAILPHVSKFRPNLVLNHTALLVYCLIESGLVQTLIEVIVTSDTFISVRATILLGELLHLSSILLPPVCHGTKMCLPTLVDCITSLKSDPLKRHRAAQAAAALTKIHQLKKKSIAPHSLGLKQIIDMEKRSQKFPSAEKFVPDGRDKAESNGPNDSAVEATKLNGDPDGEQMRSVRDPDGTLMSLLRDCSVLAQKDPLLWNWPALSNVFLWSKMNTHVTEDSSLRSIIRRLIQFYKPSSNQFCQCEFNTQKTRLYSAVGCLLMDFLTSVEEPECEKLLSEFLEDFSSVIRNISMVSSAHDSLLSPGRLSTTAYQDYFLFIGRLSANANGTTALERAGIFQDLLELVTSTNHDCYLKVVVSHLDYHTDGYARAILKKVLMGPVESGRTYATHHLRVLLRSAVMENNSAGFAKWGIPLLLNQLKDNCRTVVMTAADILDEATDDSSCIEVLIPLQSQFNQLIQQQEQQHLGLRGRLLLIKTISTPSGFKLWNQDINTEAENDQDTSNTSTFIQKELINWVEHFNVRYVQMVESDLADGLTHHQRADDGRYGRLSNARHAIRELPVPPHLFSQLNQHREGLDFVRMSGFLSQIFSCITSGSSETDKDIIQLKAAIWAAGHLGTSEAGVSLLESAQVVDAFIRIAASSPVLALRGTAFFALNLVATTSAGADLLSRFGWASIKRHHGELWHVIDDSEWICFQDPSGINLSECPDVLRERIRSTSQSSSYSVTFARDFADSHSNKGLLTSTPVRTGACSGAVASSWETESQPYSLEGSSIHFDSDSEADVDNLNDLIRPAAADATQSADRSRRAYTLPPSSHSGSDHVAHFRSFSDSHYPAEEMESVMSNAQNPRRPSVEARIWNKLRSSFRLRKSKRFSLPGRSSDRKESSPPASSTTSPVQMVHFESSTTDASSTNPPENIAQNETSSDEETVPSLLQAEFPLNRMGSVLSHVKQASHKKKLHSRTGRATTNKSCFIGLCLPIVLSSFYPEKESFDPLIDVSNSSSCNSVSDETQFDHEADKCFLCSKGLPSSSLDDGHTDEERLLVRKELLRLVFNMGSSVGLNANEQGLLRLKQRFPWAFHDVCIFSDICHALAVYGYRLRARRFLHELFMDSPFIEFFAEAVSRLKEDAANHETPSAHK